MRALVAAVLAAAFALTAPTSLRAQEGVLVDRVVATVGTTPVTASEVAMEAALRERITALDADDRAVFGQLLTEPRDALEAVLFRSILIETPEFSSIRITDDVEAYERYSAFEATFEDRREAAAFRRSWGLTRVLLMEYFRASVVLDTTVVLSVSPNVRVTEDDERRFYEQEAERVFGSRPFEDVREAVARRVYAQKYDQAYQGWRKRLRAGVRIRYLR